ncbi:hypothetical protein [Maliponia aquimaris]|uniref:Uncharacterized protein n=1 Tax=Maliponia aquimaris TaxID=1673631 RepID=A0A238KJ77_9RHOB|nr:hypothetical protein [Maliponia aquimaris]SMX42747.1 hypothetical protein MAA8898_02701 [Maliponia aquimaris]
MFGSDGTLFGAYEDRMQREHVADEYTHAADPDGAALCQSLMQPELLGTTDPATGKPEPEINDPVLAA